MQMFNNNEHIVNKFIQKFVEDSPGILGEIETAINDGDLERVDLASHKLKSHCKYLGLNSIAEQAASIESLAQSSSSKETLISAATQLRSKLEAAIASMT